MGCLDKYLDNLSKEFERCSMDNIGTASNEQKITYLYAYYHYYNADNSKLSDIVGGEVWDATAADRISGVYIDTDSDYSDIDIIIPCYVSDGGDFDFPISMKSAKDAETLLLNWVNGQSIRDSLSSIFSDEDYQFSANKPLKIRIVTNYSPKTQGKKKSILNALQALKPVKEYISYLITFGQDIEYEILEIEDPKEYVDDAVIEIDSADNCTYYGEEKSILANVSAQSIQRLYEQYGYRGLFAQNLRYYVKNTKIDSGILDSIQLTPEMFWYLNNGIIIICDDYYIDGKELLLSKFSIINGGQTTKLIGEASIENDFFLQCKIIRNKYKDEKEKIEFIAKVAEASNTQKPIKEKDLIANKPEQRLLKRQLAEAGIYCQIKRGEKVNKKLYPNAWQNTTNEELGQFLLSFVYQKPGIARASKASIYGNSERYSLLFGKKYNSNLLGDLLKIKAYYKLWTIYTKKTDDGEDQYKLGLVNNGMLFMTAIIGVICKFYYHPDYCAAINKAIITEQKIEIASQHDLDHSILQEGLTKEDYFQLFELCYSAFYRPGYEFMKSFKGRNNNYSNFTKVDSNYKTYVFRQICSVCSLGMPDSLKQSLAKVFVDVSDDELARDNQLLVQYVNVLGADTDALPDIPEGTVSSIKEALVDYRTRTYKKNHIKAYEVFKNAACDRIAKHAPTNVDDLRDLRCLDESQLELYGEDIVAIVSKIITE